MHRTACRRVGGYVFPICSARRRWCSTAWLAPKSSSSNSCRISISPSSSWGLGQWSRPPRTPRHLHDNGQPDLVRQIIKRIIEVARKGERAPDELCARALQALGFRIAKSLDRAPTQLAARIRRARGAGLTCVAAPAPVTLCVDVLGFHIGLESSLELAHQRHQAGHLGDRIE